MSPDVLNEQTVVQGLIYLHSSRFWLSTECWRSKWKTNFQFWCKIGGKMAHYTYHWWSRSHYLSCIPWLSPQAGGNPNGAVLFYRNDIISSLYLFKQTEKKDNALFGLVSSDVWLAQLKVTSLPSSKARVSCWTRGPGTYLFLAPNKRLETISYLSLFTIWNDIWNFRIMFVNI